MNKNWLLLPMLALTLTACDSNRSTTGKGYHNEATTANPEQDRAIVGRVREIIIQDPNFSPKAKEVEVIAIDGVVTLKGQVGSDDEKSNIENKIKNLHGVKKVDNQLTVSPRH